MKYLFSLLLLIIISGCEEKQIVSSPEKINTSLLKNYVSQAIDSSLAINNKLANLVSYPVQKNYVSIIVDSLIISNKTYYYAILENPDPVYSRFAVYDSILTPLLLDKSFNGKIYLEKINAAGKEFLKTDEAYLSKDTLVLNRLSLYLPDSSGISLVFRTHTKLAEPEVEYFQDITQISDSLIKTTISSSQKKSAKREDDFIYNPSTNKYTSEKNLFDVFIKEEIENFGQATQKEETTDSTAVQ